MPDKARTRKFLLNIYLLSFVLRSFPHLGAGDTILASYLSQLPTYYQFCFGKYLWLNLLFELLTYRQSCFLVSSFHNSNPPTKIPPELFNLHHFVCFVPCRSSNGNVCLVNRFSKYKTTYCAQRLCGQKFSLHHLLEIPK